MLRLTAPLLASLGLVLGLCAVPEQAHAQGMPSFGGGGGMRGFDRGPMRRDDDRGGPKGPAREDFNAGPKGPSRDDSGGGRSRSMGDAFGKGAREGRKPDGGGKSDLSSRSGPRIERETGTEPRGGRFGKQDRDGARPPKPGRETAGDDAKRGPKFERETAGGKLKPPSSRTERAATDGNSKNPRPKADDVSTGQDPKRPWPSRDPRNPTKAGDVATGGDGKNPRDPKTDDAGTLGDAKNPWPTRPSRDPKNPPMGGDVATGGGAKPPRDPSGGKPPSTSGGGNCFDHICPDSPSPGGANPPKGGVLTGGDVKPPRDPMTPPKGGGVVTGDVKPPLDPNGGKPPSSGGGNCFDHICPDNPTPPGGSPTNPTPTNDGGTLPCRGSKCPGQPGGNPTPTNDGGTPPCRGPRCPGQPGGNPTPTNDGGTPPCRGPRCPGQPDGNPTPTNDDGTPPCRGPRCGDGPDRDPPRPWPPGRPPIIVLDPVIPPPADDAQPSAPPAVRPPVYELASPDRPRQPQPPARQADRAPPQPPLPPFDAPMPSRRAFTTAEQPPYRANELLVTLQGQDPDALAGQLAQAFNLTIQESQAFTLLADRRVYRFGIPDNRAVEGLALAVATIPGVAQTSPNFYHFLQGAGGGDAGWLQYALPKLRIPDTEGLVSGRGVTIAVIDSGVDTDHPALKRANIMFFDAVEGGVKDPDAHGTAITGIIAGKGDVNGIAPGAKILAIRAFAPERLGAAPITTSMALARATDMAVARGARVVNMSFAGPRDPLLQSLIEAAYGKNIVFVAAAGNQGPQAPASYPAAYEQVIGITATDENDGLYAMANRGPYVSIAAPGVDILVPVTGQGLDYMSGTSFAAAHISGIAALLMERNAKLGPEDIRSILLNAAHDLGKAGYDEDFGAGLADAYGALISASPNLQSSVNR
jgi:subtilisin family serine protease